MYVSDSSGNVTGIEDSEDSKRLNLINVDSREIKIKINEAHQYSFHYFVYNDGKVDQIVTMNLIIEDGYKKDGNYIYKLPK